MGLAAAAAAGEKWNCFFCDSRICVLFYVVVHVQAAYLFVRVFYLMRDTRVIRVVAV